jgi:predicted ribosomally synthesized peptide with SipW-like signal peptide
MNTDQHVNGGTVATEEERRRRKPVVLLLLFAALAAVIGGGTFASFSASTTNADNSFRSGKMVLRNTDGLSTCVSAQTGDVDINGNDTCDQLFSNALLVPGMPAVAPLTLTNESIDVLDADLSFWASNCVGGTVGVPAGTDDICDDLYFFVADYTGGTYQGCEFPNTAPDETACRLGASMAALGNNALTAAPLGELDATGSREFRVGVLLPNLPFDANGIGGNNGHQYRTATFDLTWRIASV